MNKKEYLIIALIVILLGLCPLLWYRPGELMVSVDVTLPFTLEQCHQYLYAWNYQLGTGMQFMLDPSYLIFNYTGGIIRALGYSIDIAQKVQFVFWFMLAGFGMYFMMRALCKGKYNFIATLIAVVFYMFNLYLPSIWSGFNKPNIAMYATLPFLIAIFIKGLEKKYSFLKAASLLGLVSVLSSVVGTNTPILIVSVIPFLVLFVTYLVKAYRLKDRNLAIRTCIFTLISFLVVVLINFFWILPQVISVYKNISEFQAFEDIKSNAYVWLQGVSQNTGFINVIRMQGDWTWYAGHGDPYVPYAHIYQSNSFFIFLSWITPVLVMYGLIMSKIKYRSFFAGLAFIGIFFGMGSHRPTGYIFDLFFKYIPFFWALRSSWFKFTMLTCLGFAFLLGCAADRIYGDLFEFAKRCKLSGRLKFFKKNCHRIFIIFIILVILIYAYPFVFGKMFVAKEERESSPPLRLKFPEYVFEAANWINNQDGFFRIFCLTGRLVWANDWGFGGRFSSIYYFTDIPIVSEYRRGPISQEAPKPTIEIIESIRENFSPSAERFTANIARILSMLGVKYILQEDDFNYNALLTPDSSENLNGILKEQSDIDLANSFGEWKFYSIKHPFEYFYLTKKADFVLGDVSDLIALSNTELINQGCLIFESQLTQEQKKDILDNIEKLACLVVFDLEKAEDNQYSHLINDEKISLSYIISTDEIAEQMLEDEEKIDLISNDIRVEFGPALNKEIIWNNQKWRWFNPHKDCIIVNNDYQWPIKTTLIFDILSYKTSRPILGFLNDKPIAFDINILSLTITPEVSQIVIKNIELKPGRNIISFCTPNSSGQVVEEELKNQGVSVGSFCFKDIEIGNFLFKKILNLPQREYQIEIYPFYASAISDVEINEDVSRFIVIDAQKVPLKTAISDTGSRYWQSEVINLESGQHSIEFAQVFGEDYHIRFKSLPLKVHKREKVKYQKINPIFYKVDLTEGHSGFLIFNESFHPGWIAAQAGSEKEIAHFKCNGFANAYFLNGIRETKEIEIKYLPQVWNEIGRKTSLITLFVILICLPIAFIFKK